MFNSDVSNQVPEQGEAGTPIASNLNNDSTSVSTLEPPSAATPLPGLAQVDNSYSIVWKGSPNFWSGRDGNTAVAICDHIMQGSMDSTNGWFKNRRSDVSSHFGVGQDGRIWQWVKVEDTAWANGIPQSPDMALDWLAECVRKNINPNSRTVSIEHEGYSGKTFPDAQYKATLWLHRYLCSTYNIQADRQHIVGHYQISARDRANCPGSTFPWSRLIADLSDLTNSGGGTTTTGSGGGTNTTPAPASKWTDGVAGVVIGGFGPGTVNINKAYVRSRPSLSSQDKTLLRTLPKGKVLRFSAYTDAGPDFKGGVRWYLIADSDGGGWIHSSMIS